MAYLSKKDNREYSEKLGALGLDYYKINQKRINKRITNQVIADYLNVSNSCIWASMSDESSNPKMLFNANKFIDDYDVRFVNIKPHQMTDAQLNKLGFSRWEIEKLLNK